MDASPYRTCSGTLQKGVPACPDGIKVPRWKFIHGKDNVTGQQYGAIAGSP